MQHDGTDATPPWDDLRLLLAVHRHGSFLGAGAALGLATSTVARRIVALEAALGRRLVHSTRAGTSLEPDAAPLVALAEALDLGLRALGRDAGRDEPAGTVRVSLSDGFVHPLTRRLCELRRAHPSLLLEVLSDVRRADIARREADVGVRVGRSPSPAVVERRIGRATCGLYAAPAYVERRMHAASVAVADLGRHDFIGWEGPAATVPPLDWPARHGAERFVFRSNTYHAILEATLAGQGIALLADPGVRGLPGLVRLRIDAALPEVTVYLVFLREVARVPRVRLVIDALAAALREGLR